MAEDLNVTICNNRALKVYVLKSKNIKNQLVYFSTSKRNWPQRVQTISLAAAESPLLLPCDFCSRQFMYDPEDFEYAMPVERWEFFLVHVM